MKHRVFAVILAYMACMCSWGFSQDGILKTNAGVGTYDDSGDNAPATNASMKTAVSVLGLSDGSYLIVDSDSHRVRKVDSLGIISAFAGIGTPGYSGDGAQAIDAELNSPSDVATDSLGITYIADAGNHVVRIVDVNGIISTLNMGEVGISFNYPRGLGVDAANNLYITDQIEGIVVKVEINGYASIVAGDSSKKGSDEGDGGPAISAGLSEPGDISVAQDGTLYILEMARHRIRKVDAPGVISVFAGTGSAGYTGDGGLAAQAQFYFDAEQSSKLELTPDSRLLIADSGNHVIRCITLATNMIETLSGNGIPGFTGDNQWALDGEHIFPYGVGCLANGDLLIADSGNSRVRQIQTGFQTLAGANTTVSIGSEVVLDFKNVTVAGEITVDVRDSSNPPLPGDLQVNGGRYFDIQTTASFSGNIVVTLAYDDANPADEVEDLQNKILHYTGSTWQDATTAVYPSLDEVEGKVNSLSPFAIVKPTGTAVYTPFRRGDANADGVHDISDGVFILLDLFVDPTKGTCDDAEDINDDGAIDVSDAIYLLMYLFVNGPVIPPPGPDVPGIDLSGDTLGCESYSAPERP